VQLKIRKKYKPIYRDATMLLRPKTGLKDMIVEMNPGTKSAGALPDGGTIPVANTAPDVNLDEVLGSLDSDTRAYLQILVNGGGQAFSRKGYTSDLRQTFKRFEPTNRDLAKITGLLSARRQNLKHVIHNFSQLTQALGQRDTQITQLVDSANANFRALADQDANLRSSLQLLPGTLSTARTTLVKANGFARELGPTLQHLRPFARALGPSLAASRPFLRTTTPVIQNQLRPFARQVQPPVHELRVTAQNLKPLTPHLTNTFRVVNSLVNELTYNPPGPEEGYLFWASWLNHAASTLFSTQDANGPVRRGMILISCQSAQLLEQITSANPSLNVLYQLLHSPPSSQICPGAVPPASAKKGAH
jgi:phospholipid/cholesterol/gamma-HCH transport system substrate-binding protein